MLQGFNPWGAGKLDESTVLARKTVSGRLPLPPLQNWQLTLMCSGNLGVKRCL
jgi:hypothetical protein